MRTAILIATLLASSASAADFGTIGEACTSPSESKDLSVAWRMFTTTGGPCPRDVRAQLRAIHPQRTLEVGKPFRLQSLRVVALDSANHVASPIALTVESDSPELDLNAFQVDNNAGVIPRKAGTYHIRMRALANGAQAMFELIVK